MRGKPFGKLVIRPYEHIGHFIMDVNLSNGTTKMQKNIVLIGSMKFHGSHGNPLLDYKE